MREMRFKKHLHNQEKHNLTVRRGIKWATLEPGEEIRLVSTYGKGESLLARILGTRPPTVMRFCDIPEDLLCFERDPFCTTLRGLADAMRMTYVGFSENEIVTLVWYDVGT